eukprot:2300046-Ditylum_brightwellii.AAC.1
MVSTMTGDIAQPVENNTKNTHSVRFTKEPTTPDTDNADTLSSTEISSVHQRRISARTHARNELQPKNTQSEKPPPKDPGEVHQE